MLEQPGGLMPIMFLNFILILVLIGLGTYGLILFIKLARRGVKALDIYIEKNSKDISEE